MLPTMRSGSNGCRHPASPWADVPAIARIVIASAWKIFIAEKLYAEVANRARLRDDGGTHGPIETPQCADEGPGTHLARAKARARRRAARHSLGVSRETGGSTDGGRTPPAGSSRQTGPHDRVGTRD